MDAADRVVLQVLEAIDTETQVDGVRLMPQTELRSFCDWVRRTSKFL
jgi:hypothetical protein